MVPIYRAAAILIAALTSLVTGASMAPSQDSAIAVEPSTLLTTHRLVTRASVVPSTLLTTRRLATRASVVPSAQTETLATTATATATVPTFVTITKTELSNTVVTPHTLAERDYTSGKFLVLEGTRTAAFEDGR